VTTSEASRFEVVMIREHMRRLCSFIDIDWRRIVRPFLHRCHWTSSAPVLD